MSDIVFKKSAVYQKFNLKELFGVDFSDKRDLVEAIGLEIIERIRSRTEQNKFRPGEKVPAKNYKYSHLYMD
jgi:hypothetical protein